MPEAEARMILNVKPKASDAEILEVRAPLTERSVAMPPRPRANAARTRTHAHRQPRVRRRRLRPQAHEKLVAMNDPAKGGSAYLSEKIGNARDALVDVPAASTAEAPPKDEGK